MEKFAIRCPWCRKESAFEVDSITASLMPPIYIQDDLNGVLVDAEKKGRLFKCQNPDCWAPVQAVICKGLATAKFVEKTLSRVTCFSPQRVPLKVPDTAVDESIFSIAFNREPLSRWKEIHVSSLIDVDIVATFLSSYAGLAEAPVILFEAWASKIEEQDHVYWIPVLPREKPDVGNSPNYRSGVVTYFRRMIFPLRIKI